MARAAPQSLTHATPHAEPSQQVNSNLKSDIPFKWPGGEQYFGGNAMSATQEQQRTAAQLVESALPVLPEDAV